MLDAQKTWPCAVLALGPVAAVAGLTVASRRRGDGELPAGAFRAGLFSAAALVAFELFPHDRLRPVDVAVPVAATGLAALADRALRRRALRRGAATPPATRAGRRARRAGRDAATAGLATAAAVLTLLGAGLGVPHPTVPEPTAAAMRSGRVETEGDTLYYEVRGQGRPLLLVAGGGGDGGYYRRLADVLAPEYQVITYDRRGNARSTRHHPRTFSLEQQARDALAVLRAAGHDAADVMGSSGGGLIALQFAADHPQAVHRMVVHEAPLVAGDRRVAAFLHSAALNTVRYGTWAGSAEFLLGLGVPASALGATPPEAQARGYDAGFVLDVEIPGVLGSAPDVARVTANRVPVVCAVGDLTRRQGRIQGAGMARLAADLHAPLVVFPGHHLSYQDDPVGWAAALRSALQPDAR